MKGGEEGRRQAWAQYPGFPSYTSPVANRVCPFAFPITLNFLKRPLDEERSDGTWRDGRGEGRGRPSGKLEALPLVWRSGACGELGAEPLAA